MNGLLAASEFLRMIVRRIGLIAAWSSVLLVGIILFDVITRRFFSLGSAKLQEFEWHLHTILFMFCLGLGYLRDSHVRIDIIRERLSERTKCWIEVFGILFFMIPFCLIVIYYGGELTHRSFLKGEVSASATGLPYRWLIKSAIPLGMSVLLMSGVSLLLKHIHTLLNNSGGRDASADRATET